MGSCFTSCDLLLMLHVQGFWHNFRGKDPTSDPPRDQCHRRPFPLFNTRNFYSYRSIRVVEGDQLGQPKLRKTRLQTVACVIFRSNPVCGGGRGPFPGPSYSWLVRKAKRSRLAWVLPLGGEVTCQATDTKNSTAAIVSASF